MSERAVESVAGSPIFESSSIDLTSSPPPAFPIKREPTEVDWTPGSKGATKERDQAKISKTILFVSLSNNDYGAVPVELSSCPDIDSFVSTVLDAWSLEDGDKRIEAITVRCLSNPNDRQIVVTKKIPFSFTKLMDKIEAAGRWKDGEDCELEVKIHIAG